MTKASEHARLLTSGYIFCLPKVQIRFFYLIFSGMCCLKMAALGKDGFINLFLAKPLLSSLMDTQKPRYKPILLQCVVFFPHCIFSLYATNTWLSLPLGHFYPACVPFGCYSVLSASQKINGDGADACTYSVRSCALFPGFVFYISFNYCKYCKYLLINSIKVTF